MAINGTHAIFRLTTGSPSTETGTTDKIEFNGTPVVPDARGFLDSIRPVYQAIDTQLPNPGSQDSPTLPDTGNAPFILELKGHFDEGTGTAGGINTLSTWSQEPKVIKTLYPKGRFGFRSDERNEYDLTPVPTSGYHLTSIDILDPLESPRIDFVIRLTHEGDLSLRGT